MLFISASVRSTQRRPRGPVFSRSRRNQGGESHNSVAPSSNPLARPPRYPSALPCTCLYDVYPEEIGPTANVVLSNTEEVRKWLLVARPVPAEEAEAQGGCLVIFPVDEGDAAPLYYCLTDPDDVVYGRATYHCAQDEKVEQCAWETAVDATETTTGFGMGCTDASENVSAFSSPTGSPHVMFLPA